MGRLSNVNQSMLSSSFIGVVCRIKWYKRSRKVERKSQWSLYMPYLIHTLACYTYFKLLMNKVCLPSLIRMQDTYSTMISYGQFLSDQSI